VAGLSVQYFAMVTASPTQQISPTLQIVNNGASSVDLTTLTMRYYYTKDGCSHSDQTFVCYFAQIGSGVISGDFVTTTGTNADEYLEVSFLTGAGTLAPGANTGEIQASFHSTDYQCMFNQTNDYSFDATKTAFATWSNVTLYQNGTLVWGTEP
jgi:hypothetical protein